jgi:hypothetical protein
MNRIPIAGSQIMECPNCGAEATFWMRLKASKLLRYKCAECEARYKISPRGTGGMAWNFQLWVFAYWVLWLAAGNYKSVLELFFLLGICLGLEVVLQKYISDYGMFIKIDTTEPSDD